MHTVQSGCDNKDLTILEEDCHGKKVILLNPLGILENSINYYPTTTSLKSGSLYKRKFSA
jgi:hypothetical protein